MAGNTKIEWCDAVWNPIRGCTRVSEGCRNCYAERQAIRSAGPGKPYEGLVQIREIGEGRKKRRVPQWTGKLAFAPDLIDYPLRLRKPHRIFVNSMSDMFHEQARDEWLAQILGMISTAKQHTFLVLTKRPARMRAWCESWCRYLGKSRMPENLWLGVSVEDQATADARIPELLATPAAVRWISYEPALGPLNLLQACQVQTAAGWGARLHWIVAGGESGPGARPAHPDWFCSIRDQCAADGTPFFFKQWGAWEPFDASPDMFQKTHTHIWGPGVSERTKLMSVRVGKRSAGRRLDGREWNQFPERKTAE